MDAKISELERAAPAILASSRRPASYRSRSTTSCRQPGENLNARVVVLGGGSRTTSSADVADSRSFGASSDLRATRSRSRRRRRSARLRTACERQGDSYAEVAIRVRTPGTSSSSPRRSTTRSRTSGSSAGACSSPGLVALADLVARRLPARLAASHGGSAGSRRRPSGSPTATSRRRSSTRGRDEVGQLARRVRRHAPAPGRPRPRAPRVHRQRLARAADAALLARRLRRAAGRRGHGRRAMRREFLAEMRDQIDRLTRLATDLLDLSRLDAGQLEVEIVRVRPRRDRAARRRRVPRPWQSRASTSCASRRDAPGGRRSATRCACSRSPASLVENAIRHTPRGHDGRRCAPRRRTATAPSSRSATTGPGSRPRTRSTSSSASTGPRAARPRAAASASRSPRSSPRAWTGSIDGRRRGPATPSSR